MRAASSASRGSSTSGTTAWSSIPRAAELAGEIRRFREAVGLPVEDKTLSLSYHYREAEDEERARAELEAVAVKAQAAGLDARWGRKVLEIRPPVPADKGTADQSAPGAVGRPARALRGRRHDRPRRVRRACLLRARPRGARCGHLRRGAGRARRGSRPRRRGPGGDWPGSYASCRSSQARRTYGMIPPPSVLPLMTDNFHMTPDEFRRHGREVVDWVADYMERVGELPIPSGVAPETSRPSSRTPCQRSRSRSTPSWPTWTTW